MKRCVFKRSGVASDLRAANSKQRLKAPVSDADLLVGNRTVTAIRCCCMARCLYRSAQNSMRDPSHPPDTEDEQDQLKLNFLQRLPRLPGNTVGVVISTETQPGPGCGSAGASAARGESARRACAPVEDHQGWACKRSRTASRRGACRTVSMACIARPCPCPGEQTWQCADQRRNSPITEL